MANDWVESPSVWRLIIEDWRVNRGYPKSQVVLVLFRLACHVRGDLASSPSWGQVAVGLAYQVQQIGSSGSRSLGTPESEGGYGSTTSWAWS